MWGDIARHGNGSFVSAAGRFEGPACGAQIVTDKANAVGAGAFNGNECVRSCRGS